VAARVYVHLGNEKQRPLETLGYVPGEWTQVLREVREAKRDERPVRVQVGAQLYSVLDDAEQRKLEQHLRELSARGASVTSKPRRSRFGEV